MHGRLIQTGVSFYINFMLVATNASSSMTGWPPVVVVVVVSGCRCRCENLPIMDNLIVARQARCRIITHLMSVSRK